MQDIKGHLDSVDCPFCGQASDYWLDGWAKEGKSGKFYSLSVKPKEAKASESERVDDGDIPF